MEQWPEQAGIVFGAGRRRLGSSPGVYPVGGAPLVGLFFDMPRTSTSCAPRRTLIHICRDSARQTIGRFQPGVVFPLDP
jgi:hypothetical protein